VYEFGVFVAKSVNDSRYEYIHELIKPEAGFCASSAISSRFGAAVQTICTKLLSSPMYSRVLVNAFEQDLQTDWSVPVSMSSGQLDAMAGHHKSRVVCTTIGACTPQELSYIRAPETVEEIEWTDDCRICRAVTRYRHLYYCRRHTFKP
jgi:hypothetical protein